VRVDRWWVSEGDVDPDVGEELVDPPERPSREECRELELDVKREVERRARQVWGGGRP
jgi:hypothetical protein